LDLLVTSFVLLLLFVATYSKRRTWIALGSTALSIALITGFVFLSTAREPNPVRDGLARLATKLPSGWDQRALDLANAIEQVSVASVAARKRAAERPPERILAASISDWFSLGPWFKTKTKTEPDAKPETKPASEAGAEAPIKWSLDQPATNDMFALSGTNISDQPLVDVQAVLKPDADAKVFDLTLQPDRKTGKNGSVIPPGARFSLAASALTKDEAKHLGGAILSVSYLQDGSRKTSIMYLSPPTIAALTASD
jgi:hypothetical protein